MLVAVLVGVAVGVTVGVFVGVEVGVFVGVVALSNVPTSPLKPTAVVTEVGVAV